MIFRTKDPIRVSINSNIVGIQCSRKIASSCLSWMLFYSNVTTLVMVQIKIFRSSAPRWKRSHFFHHIRWAEKGSKRINPHYFIFPLFPKLAIIVRLRSDESDVASLFYQVVHWNYTTIQRPKKDRDFLRTLLVPACQPWKSIRSGFAFASPTSNDWKKCRKEKFKIRERKWQVRVIKRDMRLHTHLLVRRNHQLVFVNILPAAVVVIRFHFPTTR